MSDFSYCDATNLDFRIDLTKFDKDGHKHFTKEQIWESFIRTHSELCEIEEENETLAKALKHHCNLEYTGGHKGKYVDVECTFKPCPRDEAIKLRQQRLAGEKTPQTD